MPSSRVPMWIWNQESVSCGDYLCFEETLRCTKMIYIGVGGGIFDRLLGVHSLFSRTCNKFEKIKGYKIHSFKIPLVVGIWSWGGGGWTKKHSTFLLCRWSTAGLNAEVDVCISWIIARPVEYKYKQVRLFKNKVCNTPRV